MDSDFFAAPPAPSQPAFPPAYVPIKPSASPARRSSGGLAWVVGALVLAVASAAAVAAIAGGGAARHEANTVDRLTAAHDASIQAELMRVAMEQHAYYAENGQYGSAQEIGSSEVRTRSVTLVTGVYDDAGFCLKGVNVGTKNVYYYSSEGGLLPLGQTCS